MLQGEHSAILWTFIKLTFSIETFVLSTLDRFYCISFISLDDAHEMSSINFPKIKKDDTSLSSAVKVMIGYVWLIHNSFLGKG